MRYHQLQVYGNAPEQTFELDEHYDDGAYDADDQPCADEDEHQDAATRVRRLKLVVAMAIFSLAFAGTVGAFGYRAMISGALLPVVPPIIKATSQPIKIAPASDEPHAKNAANASQVDTVTTGSIEKLVSREEQPVTIVPPKPTSRVISTIPSAKTRSPAWARRPRLRLWSRRRCLAKGCRAAQRRLRTLHRRVLAHQVQGTSPLH
jgi:hypothetical protein